MSRSLRTVYRALSRSRRIASLRRSGNLERLLDPTGTQELQDLKGQALSSLRGHPKFERLKSARSALVLSGGGAKGAYEAGAILALFDCGITNFQAIAGTSVGGLNAALYHQLIRKKRRRQVVRLWRNLSFGKVLSLRPHVVVKVASFSLMSIAAHGNVLEMARQISSEFPPNEMTGTWREWIVDPILSLAGRLIAAAFGLVMAFVLIMWLAPPSRQFLFGSERGGLVFLVCVLWVVPWLAGHLSRRVSLFANSPLKQMIERIDIKDVVGNAPDVVCTIADESQYRGHGRRATYVPLRLVDSPTLAVNVLLQSAAIPEVFPTQELWGRAYVDGGVVDNTPIVPVAQAQLDPVVVVYLDHRVGRVFDRRNWHHALYELGGHFVWDRRSAIMAYEIPRLAELVSRDPTLSAELYQWANTASVLPIVPSTRLGNIATGTLNFTPQKGRRLMALGYRDALQQIVKWCADEPQPQTKV